MNRIVEAEEIRVTILDYQKLIKSILLLREQIERAGVSMDRERKVERLIKLERKMERLFRLISAADLTDLEWSFLDNLMDGLNISEVCRHFEIARQTGYAMLMRIIDKMLDSEVRGKGR